MSEGSSLPDRRKHGYKELEEKLETHVAEVQDRCDRKIEEHAKVVEKRFRRWFVIGLSAFAIIGLSSAGALIGYGFVLRAEGKQNEAIQEQRKTFIREECQDVNQRNINSSAALRQDAQEDIQNATTRAQREEIERRRDVTLGLLDTVLPVRNCEDLVTLATTGGEGS